MTRQARPGPQAFVLVVPWLLAALAACGQGTEDPGIASAGGATPSSSASSAAQKGDPLMFTRCLREHGIDVEDPGSDGGIRIHAKPGDEQRMRDADRACQKFAPGGGEGKGKPMSKEDQEKFLAFATCMRERGIPMADPDFSGGGVQIRIGGGKADPGARLDDSKVEAAQKICQNVLPEDMRPGSGPTGSQKNPGGGGSDSGAGLTTGGGA
jgi:hypothetical protein